MGLFSSSKKSTTVNETQNTSTNLAVDGQGFALSDVDGSVNVQSSDLGAIEDAFLFADEAQERALALAGDVARGAQSQASKAQSQAFDAFAAADKSDGEAVFSQQQDTFRLLLIAAAAVIALPTIVGAFK